MNVLFITLFSLDINTSVTKSNIGILDGLRKKGFKITILMPDLDNSLAYFDNTYDYSWAKVIKIKNDSLSSKLASSINKNEDNKSNFFLKAIKLLKKIIYKFRLFDRTRELVKKKDFYDLLEDYYDFVISTSDPKSSHLLAKKLLKKRIKCSKWIQHWGDPLSGDISSNSIYPQWFIRQIEKKVLSKADKIIYVSPFTCDELMQKHKKISDKMKFVPLPCDLPVRMKKNYNSLEKFKIVYLGDYSSKVRNIFPLYEAVRKMPDTFLRISGNSDIFLNSTENIIVTKRVNQIQASELEDGADLVVCVGNLHGTQIPGKLYYSASNGKPILVILDGPQKKYLEDYLTTFDRFIFCENNVCSIEKAIKAIKECYNDYTFSTPFKLFPESIVEEILND